MECEYPLRTGDTPVAPKIRNSQKKAGSPDVAPNVEAAKPAAGPEHLPSPFGQPPKSNGKRPAPGTGGAPHSSPITDHQ
ncbi:hypothetical protein PLANPX_5809 [Lacipirellula parvula]|uniref:Uncharacterized protein n=1 Tax=Lacipirellula parvula TaxID=2650471 RepID=A0A5K7XJB6_9BACT|nr:hypothetical protein PLANPX_5809 [Lacipirellula parvula]